MKNTFKVFKFEFRSIVLKKAYIISTIVLLAIIIGLSFFGKFILNKTINKVKSSRVYALAIDDSIDFKNQLKEILEGNNNTHVELKYEQGDEEALKNLVKTGKYENALYLKSEKDFNFISLENDDHLTAENKELADHISKIILQQKLLQLGISEAAIQDIYLSANINTEILKKTNDNNGSLPIAYSSVFIVYMLILSYGSMVSTRVLSEKSTRTMEVLVTTTSSNSLIFGKVLATCAAAILQFLILSLAGYFVFMYNFSYLVPFIFPGLSIAHYIFTFAYTVLGFLLYAFLIAGVSSFAEKIEDLQGVLTPINMIIIIAFVYCTQVLSSGSIGSTTTKVLSYVPFSSPFIMLARYSANTASVIEVCISLLALALSVLLFGMLSAKIYRTGVYMYGKKPTIKNIINALISK